MAVNDALEAKLNIANSTNRTQPYAFDARRYRARNGIERMFARLKGFRRIAARYDKKAENVMAALCLAALICYWIRMGPDPGKVPKPDRPATENRC